MHRPYPLAGAGAAATAATTSTTTTAAGGAAELEWTKRVPIAKGTARRIQTPTARRWWVAVPPLATEQPTNTCAARPPQEASAHTPTTKTPTHSLKVPIPQSSFYSWEE